MTNISEEVHEYIKEGDKLSKIPFFTFNMESRLTDAYNSYGMAINLLKTGRTRDRNEELILEVLEKKLNVLKRIKDTSNFEFANEYLEYAKLQAYFKKSNDAINSYLSAINFFTKTGNSHRRQELLVIVAELYENKADLESALKYYDDALCADMDSNAIKIEEKIAKIRVQLKLFESATAQYENLTKKCIDSDILKFSALKYLFKATLCGICWRELEYEKTYNEYLNDYPVINSKSREVELLNKVFEAIHDHQIDKFVEAMRSYDTVTPFDNIDVELLSNIKKIIEKEEELR